MKEGLVIFVFIICCEIALQVITGVSVLEMWAQWWFWTIIVLGMIVLYVLTTRPRIPRTTLEEGERVVIQSPGGRFLEDNEKSGGFLGSTVSTGRWFLTNRRLIYQGTTQSVDLKRAIINPLWTKDESDVHIYHLDKLKDVKVIDEGLSRKFILVSFEGEDEAKIILRGLDNFAENIRRVANEFSVKE